MRKKADLYQKFSINASAVLDFGIITNYYGNFLPKKIILINFKSKWVFFKIFSRSNEIFMAKKS